MAVVISADITLQPLLRADSTHVLNLVNDSRPQLGQFLYWVNDVIDLASAEQYIEQRINSGLPNAQWHTIVFNNEVCGVFAIKSIDPDTGVAEVGYWLSHRVHGNGIISDILPHVPRLANIKTIEFRCLDKNIASINVAKKFGAEHISTSPNFIIADGINQDLLIFQKHLPSF